MKLFIYAVNSEMSIVDLPGDTEGTLNIHVINNYGNRENILEAESDGTNWVLYSTYNGRITVDRIYHDDVKLTPGLEITVDTIDNQYQIICSESSGVGVLLYQLPKSGTLTIGGNGCDISCSHPLISSCHTELIVKDSDVTLARNVSSKGPVCLNRHPLQEQAVKYGDILDLYGLRLVFLKNTLAIYKDRLLDNAIIRLQPKPYSERLASEHSSNLRLINDNETTYSRPPRIAPVENKHDIVVDAPPASGKHEEMPLIFSVGTSAFMSISSLMMASNSVINAQASGSGIATVLPTVIMAGGMFVGSLILPIATRKYTERKENENEKKRQEKYLAYLGRIDQEIIEIAETQKKTLLDEYPTPGALYEKALSNDPTLWCRMPFHKDFLMLRLGTGETEAECHVQYPKQAFSLEEDSLRTAMEKLQNKSYKVEGMPIMLSLKDTGILGILGDTDERIRYLKGLLIQLCSHHSYKEMKLIFIYDSEDENHFEFARWLPHTWSDNHEFRAIGTDRDAMRNISAYIDAIASDGMMGVVILADTVLGENCTALNEKMKEIDKTNIRVIALSDEASKLPKECNSVIVLENNRGVINRNIKKMEKPVLFDVDDIPDQQMRDYASLLCNTHMSDTSDSYKLVEQLTFFDMFRCGNVGQLNAFERWNASNPIKSLATPVGIDKYGALLNLDLHQKAHGPHGLVAGMTGSGKSEFIITYILSMAINYSPSEVGFILIDYKGGGMSDTLAGLPHVVGIIDNLGGSQGIHRSLISIKSEIVRRQQVFKSVSEMTHVSNLDIYKYQAMVRNGQIKEPMQHLIIVSDEFAELKEQEGDFIEDIVSMARIGRSLGIHLILATQKPTGVVSPQIASNSRFRISLKVQDKGDSMEMLGRPEAAMLTKTGRFYLQVGLNEVFVLGQSAWSGAETEQKPKYIEEPDNTFELLNDLGETLIKARPPKKLNAKEQKKQVDMVVQYIYKVAKDHDLLPDKSWKPQLPEEMLVSDLERKFDLHYQPFTIDPVIGLADDPYHQAQYPLQLNMSENGNVLLYGFTGAGKQETINTVIYSLCCHHTAEEINIYCLDFASESTRAFLEMPQVGDVIVSGEDEKVVNFVRMMNDEMEKRRKILAGIGGNIQQYRCESVMPDILIIIENYNAFSELYEKETDDLYKLIREGNRFGIFFMITSTTTNGLRYRLTQNFKQVFCLQLVDKFEYVNAVGKTEGTEPRPRLGSGIFNDGENVLEYQTAFIFSKAESNFYQHIQALSSDIAAHNAGFTAPKVPVLPEHVNIHDLSSNPSRIRTDRIPVGIGTESMQPVYMDMTADYLIPVLFNILPEVPYFQTLGEMLACDNQKTVIMFDITKTFKHAADAKYKLISSVSSAVDMIDELYGINLKRHNESVDAEHAGQSLPVYPELFIMICDLKQLFDSIHGDQLTTEKLDAILKMGRTDINMHTIVLQDARQMNTMSMRMWYSRLTGVNGIWLGNGIKMQTILKETNLPISVSADETYGFVVNRSKAQKVKLLEER